MKRRPGEVSRQPAGSMNARPHRPRSWRALVATAAALLVVGCGTEAPGADTAQAASTSEFCADVRAKVDAFLSGFDQPTGPRYGGTAVVASFGELSRGMNAFISTDYTTRQHQNFVNLMTLVQFDENLEPVPYLAESFELSEDGTELTFHLRHDVFWHDGVPTTAEDVAFTYERVTDPETMFPNPTYWTHYDTGPGGMVVVDSFTVKVGLEPHVDYMDAWRATAIMPKHLLGDVPASDMASHPFNERCPVGNGPFVFVEHRPNESWTFARNPAFPAGLGGPPYLDRVVYRVIVDQSTLLTELLTEGIDVYSAPTSDQAAEIMRSDVADFLVFPFRQVTLVAWNSRRPQLADARVRRALTLGTNRRAIVDAILGGYGNIANASVPTFHWAYDASLDHELAYDPAAARRLLDEAGWVDRDGDGVRENGEGQRLSITVKSNDGNQTRADIAELLQAQLAQIGVEIHPELVEWNTMLDQVMNRKDFDAVVFGWVADFRIDDTDLFHSRRIDGAYALSGTQNPEIDRLLDTLQVMLDHEEALPYWHEYQRAVMEEQPYLFLYFGQRLDGVNKRLQDVVMDVRGEWISVRNWWIPEDQRKYGSVADR